MPPIAWRETHRADMGIKPRAKRVLVALVAAVVIVTGYTMW